MAYRVQAIADLLGQRAQVGLLPGICVAALRDDARAAATGQRAQFGQPGHGADHQADKVVGGRFVVEREFRALGHIGDEQLGPLHQRAVTLE